MENINKIKYLKIKACDNSDDIFLNDCIIDLSVTGYNCIIEGKWIENEEEIDLFDETIEDQLDIFMKVVDMGYYTLLDKDENILYELAGYVPEVVNYFNKTNGYGDYIDITVVYDKTSGHNIIKIPERSKNENFMSVLKKSLNRDGWQKIEE